MANTYTQIHVHVVFAVMNRTCLIRNTWKVDLYKYIAGIIQIHNHKLLAINGMPDHIHLLIGMRPAQSLSDLIQDVKGSSSKWINHQKFVNGRFEWQQGYGAFSYSKSQIATVIRYIEDQEVHHKKISFTTEYKEILKEFSTPLDGDEISFIMDQVFAFS